MYCLHFPLTNTSHGIGWYGALEDDEVLYQQAVFQDTCDVFVRVFGALRACFPHIPGLLEDLDIDESSLEPLVTADAQKRRWAESALRRQEAQVRKRVSHLQAQKALERRGTTIGPIGIKVPSQKVLGPSKLTPLKTNIDHHRP